MPIRTKLTELTAGLVEELAFDGDQVKVIKHAFVTSDEARFVTILENAMGLFDSVFKSISMMPEYSLYRFVALISPDLDAEILWNQDLEMIASIRPKRALEAGSSVYKDDIAECSSLTLRRSGSSEAIDVPPDHSLVVLIPWGWRRGLYFDFKKPGDPPRDATLQQIGGYLVSRLLFQEMYSASDEQWTWLNEHGMFPFAWMGENDRKLVLGAAAQERMPDAFLDELCGRFRTSLDSRIEGWFKQPLIKAQEPFIRTAIGHYKVDDHISCVSVLYPRIEGIMRALHMIKGSGKPKQESMPATTVQSIPEHSALMPLQFRNFLRSYYFNNFDEATGDVALSRNTVGHGVSNPADHNLRTASLGFMIIDQISYYLAASNEPPQANGTVIKIN